MELATYNVILSGKLLDDFEIGPVTEAFAQMFGLPAEKAESMLSSRVMLKKEVELQVAKSYKDRLAEIGIDAQLQRVGGIGELSLAPLQDDSAGEVDEDGNPLPGSERMECPKCHLKQARADCCERCGVYIHKVIKQAAETHASGSAIVEPQIPQAAVKIPVSATPKKKRPAQKSKFSAPQLWSIVILAFAMLAAAGYAIAASFIL